MSQPTFNHVDSPIEMTRKVPKMKFEQSAKQNNDLKLGKHDQDLHIYVYKYTHNIHFYILYMHIFVLQYL